MKNFINNKFNLIIILLFAIILGFGSNVFANYDIDFYGVSYSVPDSPTNNYFITYDNDCFYLFALDNDVDLSKIYVEYQDKGNYLYIQVKSTSDVHCCIYTCPHVNADSWILDSDYSSRNICSFADVNCVRSTITFKDSSGNVVFQGAPQEQEIPTITQTLVEQGTQAEMGETLLETIKSYLIYLVIFVVSLIAIYKAVRFLRNVLKAS